MEQGFQANGKIQLCIVKIRDLLKPLTVKAFRR